MILASHLHMPSCFLKTFTEYPYIEGKILTGILSSMYELYTMKHDSW